MSGAWWFVFGWISAASLIFVCEWRAHQRRFGWLDAQDTTVFVAGCEQLLDK